MALQGPDRIAVHIAIVHPDASGRKGLALAPNQGNAYSNRLSGKTARSGATLRLSWHGPVAAIWLTAPSKVPNPDHDPNVL